MSRKAVVHGFTLLELMMAMAVLGVVALISGSVYVSTYRSTLINRAASDLQREVRDALSALNAECSAHAYASCVWCFERIRALGGLGVFCHPYWVSQRRYDVPVALSDALFEGQPFDALELLGGYGLSEVESNVLQIARYGDERARGRRIPIVGVSDAHGCEKGELLGWYYTIVFSPSNALGDLIASIKALYSVAVEALPGGAARAYGPLRLVKYAQFLLREVFPQHDELCAEEGRHMLAYLAGDARAADRLAGLLGSTQRLFAPLWASDPGGAG